MVTSGGTPVGQVTSGNFSPMLGCGIALALLETGPSSAVVGDRVTVSQRGREIDATVVATPFWTSGGSGA